MKHIELLVVVTCLAACASTGAPPGGPVDTEAPEIVRTAPDSGRVGTTPREVIFRFNEVVSERPSSAASLAALFLISPRDGEPKVDWHREEIAVRPRRGWRKNTAYTVTMLPGISDLRGNVRNLGAVTMFATGATIPASHIAGTIFNWVEGRPVTRGLVEVSPRSDTSLVYVVTTDSAGAFVMRNLPPAAYIVRGASDDNNNRGLDRREPWDTVGINLGDSARVDVYAFVHDSLGSRLQAAVVKDSVTIDLNFDNPLSISQPLVPANVRVTAPDSTVVGVLSVTVPPPDTSASARRIKRTRPTRTVAVRLARPLVVGTTYRVRVTDARNLMGIVRSSETLLTVSKFPAAREPVTTPPPAPPPPAPIKR